MRENPGVEDRVLAAVTAVHQEQTIRTDRIDPSGIPDGYLALVMGRE